VYPAPDTALPDGDAAADSLGAALAGSDGATLGAVVAAPPLEHAVRMKTAVAPSDSSRIELRKVTPPLRPRNDGRTAAFR
jgi:hypothetical protein